MKLRLVSCVLVLTAVTACNRSEPVASRASEQPSAPEASSSEIAALIDRIKSSNGADAQAAAEFKQRVGRKHIALIIDQLNVSYPKWNPILIDALKQLVTTEDKTLILDKFKTQISLIHLVRLHHWERDVKDVLVQQIDNNTGFVPLECVEALADLKDPSTYPALKSYFVNGWNRHVTYNAISLLPGIDVSKELPVAWDKALSSSSKYEAAYLIGPVLDLGHLPAMEFVMDQLRKPSDIPTTILDPDLLSTRYLDHAGDAKEKLAFWDKNKRRLHFDATSKKFTL